MTATGGEVVIDVTTAGVNRADLLQAAGLYPPPPGASDILGLEVSGVIAEVGAGRPATVGRESIRLPDTCEIKPKTLLCE